eukprot:4351420-Ditylum_brightwellii.AAC.1
MEFEWDKPGKWKLVEKEASLYVDIKKGRIKIDRLATSTAQRILGVWIAPDGNNKTQVKELRSIAEQWADRVRLGYIKKEDAWYYYQST